MIDPSATLLRDDVEHLTDRELRPLFRFMLRARISAGGLMLVLAGLLLAYDPQPWKIALVTGGGVALATLGILRRHHLSAPRLTRAMLVELFGSVMGAHAIVITLTGGIHSPFVVVLPVVTLLASITMGRLRQVGILVMAAIALVWALAADDMIGPRPRLLPDALAEILPRFGGPSFAIVMASFLTLVMSVSMTFGLVVRRAVERAVLAAREARAETLATLRDRNRELWTLSGAIAHELKNPLASVRGLGSLLARRVEAGTKQAERMGVMLEEVERMGAIIDEFLNFSRPLTAMTRRPVEPHGLVDKVLALHRPLAEAGGVTLEAEVRATEAIACDSRKLMQVLVNLLHNAIDASPEGGTIRLVVQDREGGTRFEILDEGPGIDAQIRPRLFQSGATTKPAGSGIGLTVARAIAEQHGGTLELLDRPEGGARAVLDLPRPEPGPQEPP